MPIGISQLNNDQGCELDGPATSRIVKFRHSYGALNALCSRQMPRYQSLTGNLLRAALALAFSGFFGPAQAQVSCFVSADPAIYALQLMSSRDAKDSSSYPM